MVGDADKVRAVRSTIDIVTANTRLGVRIPFQKDVVSARIRAHIRRTSRARIAQEHQLAVCRSDQDILIAVIFPVDKRDRHTRGESGARSRPDLVLQDEHIRSRAQLIRIRLVAIKPDMALRIRRQEVRAPIGINVGKGNRLSVKDRRIK